MDIETKIIEILENVGVFIEAGKSDVDIREYGIGSLEYITFICDIETEFNIEFPAEYLSIQQSVSLENIIHIVENLVAIA